MIRNLTTNDVIVAGRREILRATMAGRPSWRRARRLPWILRTNDFFGQHPMLCLVIVAALFILEGALRGL